MKIRQIELYRRFYKNAETADAVFDEFIKNLSPYMFDWDHFIYQTGIEAKVKDIKDEVIYLEGLIGAPDIEAEFRRLLNKRPDAARALPHLVGARWDEKTGSVTIKSSPTRSGEISLDFYKPHRSKIDQYYRFFVGSGLKDLIETKKIKSLFDYLLGVEVGVATARRKGVTGRLMERICEELLEGFAKKSGYDLKREIYGRDIDGYDLGSVSPARRYDFTLRNSNQLFLIECNFYNRPGSKLKSTAGEYAKLDRDIRSTQNQRVCFIWITDGPGWLKTQKGLKDSFAEVDHIFNLDLINRGVLDVVCGVRS